MMGWMAPLRHLSAKLLSDRNSSEWESSMGEVTTIGLDLAKHVFQVHGVDAEGATVLRKQLRRAQVLAFFSRLPPCLVGLEACATAWPLTVSAQQAKHPVRIGFLPPGSPSNAYDRSLVEAFRQGLRQADLVENRDIVLDVVWISGDPDQAVNELMQRGAQML